MVLPSNIKGIAKALLLVIVLSIRNHKDYYVKMVNYTITGGHDKVNLSMVLNYLNVSFFELL